MALDPSIALQVRGLQLQSPLEQAQQVAQVASLQQALADRQRQAQMQQQAQSELAALGQNPTEEALAGWAARHAKDPGDVLKSLQSSMDRRTALRQGALDREAGRQNAYDIAMSRLDQQREATNQRLEQSTRFAEMMHEYRMMNAKTAQEQAAERARHNKVIEGITAQANEAKAEMANLRLEVAKQGKVLPGPLQKQLTEAAEMDDATQRFASTFKNDFGGYKSTVVGDVANWAKRTFGDESGQAQWWQDYELHQSQVRNKLFGSALTASEIAAWNKSAINPAMDPKQIRENLQRRANLERTAINRLMRGAAAGGYNQDQIEAFTGRQIPTEGAPAQDNDPLGLRK